MYPREAIDFEEPYVSPYLRRRCRSIEEVLEARVDQSELLRTALRMSSVEVAPAQPSAARRSE